MAAQVLLGSGENRWREYKKWSSLVHQKIKPEDPADLPLPGRTLIAGHP